MSYATLLIQRKKLYHLKKKIIFFQTKIYGGGGTLQWGYGISSLRLIVDCIVCYAILAIFQSYKGGPPT